MIRKKTTADKKRKQIIDLDGPEGNAFVLLGKAQVMSKRMGLDTQDILDEMRSGDYENLINVFDKYFSEYFLLCRS